MHDAARPLILPETIDAAIEALVAGDDAGLDALMDAGGAEAVGNPTENRACSTAGDSRRGHALDGVVCGQPGDDAGLDALMDAGGAEAVGNPTENRACSTAGDSRRGHALDGVVCGQPAVDTLKVIDEAGCFVETPPRARFWTVQTPQVFWTESLLRAYELVIPRRRAPVRLRAVFVGGMLLTAWCAVSPRSTRSRSSRRPAALWRRRRAFGFEAPRDNLKGTLPEDLAPVEAALRARLCG